MNDTITMTRSFNETFAEGTNYFKAAKLNEPKRNAIVNIYNGFLNESEVKQEEPKLPLVERLNISCVNFSSEVNLTGRKKLGINNTVVGLIRNNLVDKANFEREEVVKEAEEIVEDNIFEENAEEKPVVSLSRTSMNEDIYKEEKSDVKVNPSIDDYFQSKKSNIEESSTNEDDVIARLVQGNEEINHKIEQSTEYLNILKGKMKKKEIEDLQQKIEDNTQVLDNLMQQIREYESKLNEGKTK